MATPGQLVTKLSEILGISEGTLTVYDRVLRDAGLLSKGGRGRSSVHRTPLDAARILIALLVTPSPARAAEAVEDFGCLECERVLLLQEDGRLTFAKLWAGAEEGHTLEEALAAIIAGFGDEAFRQALLAHTTGIDSGTARALGFGAWLPSIAVTVRDTMVNATINIDGNEYIYQHPALLASLEAQRAPQPDDPLEAAEAHLKAHEPFSRVFEKYRGIRSARTIAMPEIRPIAEFVCGVADEDRV